MIDWSNLQAAMNESEYCGGPEACKDRQYDSSKEDCQKCFEDCNKALNSEIYNE